MELSRANSNVWADLCKLLNQNTEKTEKKQEFDDFRAKYPTIKKKVKPCRNISEKEVDDMVLDYERGMNVRQIAEKYKCHRTTISRALGGRNIEIQHTPPSTRGKERQIVRMYEDGMSSLLIADKIGSNQHAVLKCLHELEITLRPSGRNR